MNKISFHILRIGLAVTFLWIGVLILRNPEAWGEYMRAWAAGLLPVPVTQVMIGTAILDIIIGVFLLINLNKKNRRYQKNIFSELSQKNRRYGKFHEFSDLLIKKFGGFKNEQKRHYCDCACCFGSAYCSPGSSA